MKQIIKRVFFNMHWILTVFLILYTVIPFLSPIFFETGHPRAGWWIQTIYKFLCHQRPERSMFLFGEQLTYSSAELADLGYEGALAGYGYVGNSDIGYKVAFCIRDTFLYGSMAIAGMITGFMKSKPRIKWYVIALVALPLVMDGTIQFISEFLYLTQQRWGLDLAKPPYLSNNVTRAVTGTFFGFGIGLVLFSELKDALINGWDNGNNKEYH